MHARHKVTMPRLAPAWSSAPARSLTVAVRSKFVPDSVLGQLGGDLQNFRVKPPLFDGSGNGLELGVGVVRVV